MKMNTTILYFEEKVRMKINPIHNIFKWIFVYYKRYISIELMLVKQGNQKSAIFVTIGTF